MCIGSTQVYAESVYRQEHRVTQLPHEFFSPADKHDEGEEEEVKNVQKQVVSPDAEEEAKTGRQQDEGAEAGHDV